MPSDPRQRPPAPPGTSDYRISRAVAARLAGGLLVVLGLLVLATAVLVGLVGLPLAVLSAAVAVALVVIVVVGVAAARSTVLVRLDDVGYQVRYLRRSGVRRARWSDVEDVVTGFASEQPVVVVRLHDGRSTTIPVGLLAGDPNDFVRDLAAHAKRGHRRR